MNGPATRQYRRNLSQLCGSVSRDAGVHGQQAPMGAVGTARRSPARACRSRAPRTPGTRRPPPGARRSPAARTSPRHRSRTRCRALAEQDPRRSGVQVVDGEPGRPARWAVPAGCAIVSGSLRSQPAGGDGTSADIGEVQFARRGVGLLHRGIHDGGRTSSKCGWGGNGRSAGRVRSSFQGRRRRRVAEAIRTGGFGPRRKGLPALTGEDGADHAGRKTP